MKQTILRWLPLMALGIFWGGCSSLTPYQKHDPLSGGYWEEKKNDGVWEVKCHGGGPGFALECGAYRCAEFAFEKGRRYYVILKVDDQSNTVSTWGGGGGPSGYTGMTIYRIKIYKEKPDAKHVFDAYHVLNTTPVPGSKEPYTVKQRLRDKKQ